MGVDVHVIVVGLIQGVGGRYVYHKTMNFKEKQLTLRCCCYQEMRMRNRSSNPPSC